MKTTISQLQLFQYSVLALPLAFAGLPVYLLAPDFYATSYQMPLTMIGASLLVLRLLDALIDPLLGYLIDHKGLKLQSLMRLGAISMGVGVFILFWVPESNQEILLIWFSLAVFITTLAYSLLTIGYGVQGALWSSMKDEQVRITTTREALTLAGLILAITLPSVLSNYFSSIDTHRILALVLIICLMLAFAFYSNLQFDTKTVPKPESTPNPGSLLSPSLKILYLIYAISVLASAIPAVLIIFFVRDYLQAYDLIGVFLLLYFLAGALSMPIWRRLARKLDKLRAWMTSMLLAVSGFVLVLLCQPGDSLFYAAICLVTGFALGAELALPPAILAELLDSDARSSGLKYAGLSFLNKLSLALAAGISLPLLGVFNFQPGQPNSPEALTVLLWIYGGLPCLLKFTAYINAYFWKTRFYREPLCPN